MSYYVSTVVYLDCFTTVSVIKVCVCKIIELKKSLYNKYLVVYAKNKQFV